MLLVFLLLHWREQLEYLMGMQRWLMLLFRETEFALAAEEVLEALVVCSGSSLEYLEILECSALPCPLRQDPPLPRQSSPPLLSLAPWRLAASYLSFKFSQTSAELQLTHTRCRSSRRRSSRRRRNWSRRRERLAGGCRGQLTQSSVQVGLTHCGCCCTQNAAAVGQGCSDSAACKMQTTRLQNNVLTIKPCSISYFRPILPMSVIS